eukprot:m.180685 g.180685  ORF g.180685 m.180685 type:complete len:466 (+) comp15071_c0_seq1:47-1444(+)
MSTEHPATFVPVADLEMLPDQGLTNRGAIDAFKSLLTFRTVSMTGHLDGANTACVQYLDELCKRLGLSTEILDGPRPKKGSPVLVAKWEGKDTAAPALWLNAHYDVVPVLTEHWTKPAWDAHTEIVDGEERIYGRGAQDMKLVPIQYLVAISRLAVGGTKPKRNVFLTFVPEEEVGGAGMSYFLRSDYFRHHMDGKVGCAFDEGLASTEDAYTCFYGERTPWWVVVEAKGPTGHGSRFIQGCATQALHAFCSRALAFRSQEEAKLLAATAASHGDHAGRCDHAKHHKLGDVTTVNLTMLQAGVTTDHGETYAINVIPTEAKAGFDVRVPLTLPHTTLAATLTQWCREAEVEAGAPTGSVQWTHAPYGGEPVTQHHETSVDPASSTHFAEFQAAVEKDLGITLITEVFPAATDSRFLRSLKIPCFGFSPMRKCPVLLHEHDEYLPTSVFLEGPQAYDAILKRLAMV